MQMIRRKKISKLCCHGITNIFVLALFFSVLNARDARAEKSAYWIDHMIANCRTRHEGGGHSVLAYSDFATWCSYHYKTVELAEISALKNCKKRIPASMRKRISCKIILVDGRITDKRTIQRRREDVKTPIKLEIFDGMTGQNQTATGVAVYGKYSDGNSRPVRLVLDDGTTLCDGKYAYERYSLSFNVICFTNFSFTARRVRPNGFLLYHGYYQPSFRITLKHGRSRIRILPSG